MEAPKTRKAFNLRDHCEVVEADGSWTSRMPVIEVTGHGATADDAFQAMVGLANEKIAADESLRRAFNEWRDGKAEVVAIPEEERQAMQATIDRSTELSKNFASVTSATLDDAIAGSTPVLLDFFAEWCMPCHRLTPVLKEVADELEGKLQVLKIDADGNKDSCRRFDVAGYPTMILFEEGEEVHRIVGAIRTKERLLAELAPHI